MKTNMRMLLLIALVWVAGSAAQATDTVAVQPASSKATATTPSEPSRATEKKKERDFKAPAGYKMKMAGTRTLYCKKTTVLGTRFPREVCMTEAQLKDHLATNDSMRREKDQSSRICDNPATCGFTG